MTCRMKTLLILTTLFVALSFGGYPLDCGSVGTQISDRRPVKTADRGSAGEPVASSDYLTTLSRMVELTPGFIRDTSPISDRRPVKTADGGSAQEPVASGGYLGRISRVVELTPGAAACAMQRLGTRPAAEMTNCVSSPRKRQVRRSKNKLAGVVSSATKRLRPARPPSGMLQGVTGGVTSPTNQLCTC